MPRTARTFALPGIVLVALLLAACSAPAAQPATSPPAQQSAPASASPSTNPVVIENERPGDSSWKRGVRRADDPEAMSGYADASSVDPGEAVTLFVSTTASDYTVTAYRMGWYGGAGGRKVWRSGELGGRQQTAQGYVEATRTHYADWKPSLQVDTADWVPGMYLFRLSGSEGKDWMVPLVVRSPNADGRLVLIMSDLTWQAYNMWGGRSAYKGPAGFDDRSRAVSFSRPYSNGSGTGKYLGYEQPVVALAEQLGIPVSYVASSDLSSDEAALSGAEGVVSLGHNEYWSNREREGVAAARDAGSDLAFLGANTMYWRVRVDPDGPAGMMQEIIYKSADEDPEGEVKDTDRFRESVGAAERSLVGMDYECYPAVGTYQVATPGFFLFRGADTSVGYQELVAIEVDRAYPLPGTPDNLQVVANSPTDCAGAATVSNSTYYSAASGAGVFAVGTMGWVLRGLRGDAPPATTRFTRQVTSNLLRAMMAGPMGRAHPSRSNIGRFDLPRTNTTGSVDLT